MHEGPIGVGTRIQYSEVPLSPGNVLSDEPGYYEDGGFGIRIENIIMCKEVETSMLSVQCSPHYHLERGSH